MATALRRGLVGRIAIALFGALVLYVTWGQDELPEPLRDPRVTFTPLADVEGLSPSPGLVVEHVWQISARHSGFGGYSGLAMNGADRLTAISDRGSRLDFYDPSIFDPEARMSRIFRRGIVPKGMRDAEAVVRDPASGHLWIAYEHGNSIVRYHPSSGDVRIAWPAAMAHWPRNRGPESMARLPDGRFIVLAEGRRHLFASDVEALLFPGDPVEGAAPVPFRFAPPRGYAPADMVALPDGRVIVLLRRVVFPYPPRFTARLLLADPATIREGEPWAWHELARLRKLFPLDNYEGITVDPGADGGLTIWLISDDNTLRAQRTLLVKMRWDKEMPEQHAGR